MRRWEYRDPLEVLMRKGEDCTHCRHLETWAVGERAVTVCGKRKKVGKRCGEWQHEKGKA